nr:LPXTG cell wall anchor domain-containing protein [Lactiplantibacillus plantarum]
MAPAKPVQPMTYDKSVQTITTKFMGQRLPQTNETDQQHMTLSGLLLLAMSGLLGLLGISDNTNSRTEVYAKSSTNQSPV